MYFLLDAGSNDDLLIECSKESLEAEDLVNICICNLICVATFYCCSAFVLVEIPNCHLVTISYIYLYDLGRVDRWLLLHMAINTPTALHSVVGIKMEDLRGL